MGAKDNFFGNLKAFADILKDKSKLHPDCYIMSYGGRRAFMNALGIMVEDAPKEFDAFECDYQYDGDIETILK